MTKQNVDRLGNLPDDIICHILSFMPTELSVKTSIIAKRWRFLWAHVPILDLQGRKVSSHTTSFAGIICMLMLRHKVESLTTFRLTYTDYDVPTGCHKLETCIASAIERNVQNLDLHLPVKLPRCVLTCKTLVDLRLSGGVSIPSSGPIYLPTLKKLYFRPPDYDVHFPRLVSGCPVLEELIIDRARCLDLEGCTLSSPTLKRLTFSLFYYIEEFKLKINAPKLRYLNVHGYMHRYISVSMTNSVAEDICLKHVNDDGLKLLNSICNVKFLELSDYYYVNYNVPMPGSIVKFGNLTKLYLSANWCLQSSLKVLIIFKNLSSMRWYSKDWVDPIKEGCACLLHSLRTVRVDGFSCTEEGFNMVRFILRNAQVLERMEVNCRPFTDFMEKFDALQRISSFRRGSKECELVFS